MKVSKEVRNKLIGESTLAGLRDRTTKERIKNALDQLTSSYQNLHKEKPVNDKVENPVDYCVTPKSPELSPNTLEEIWNLSEEEYITNEKIISRAKSLLRNKCC